MSPLFTKLNLKDQGEIVVLEAPATFDAELARLVGVTVQRSLTGAAPVRFALAFVRNQETLDRLADDLASRAEGDAILWFAYPKGTSKRYRCDFHRDRGWDALGKAGWEGVRQVAIDEDWSALRFRRVEHIKTMTRDPARAGTNEGKSRTEAHRRGKSGGAGRP